MKMFQILLVVSSLAIFNLQAQSPKVVKSGNSYINDTDGTVFIFTRSMVDSIGVRARELKNYKNEVDALDLIVSRQDDQIEYYEKLITIKSTHIKELEAIANSYKELSKLSKQKWYDTWNFGVVVGVGVIYLSSAIVNNIK